MHDILSHNGASIQRLYYLKDEGSFFFLTMPLQLVLQRDSWLLLFVVLTSTWLSTSSHVTEKIYCNIFEHHFCRALVPSVWLQGNTMQFYGKKKMLITFCFIYFAVCGSWHSNFISFKLVCQQRHEVHCFIVALVLSLPCFIFCHFSKFMC